AVLLGGVAVVTARAVRRRDITLDAERMVNRLVLARAAALSGALDRKSTRLNSSHVKISYAVFCLKKKIPGSSQPATARGGGRPACWFRGLSIARQNSFSSLGAVTRMG